MILRNFDELIGVAKVRGRRRVAVALAEDELVLKGMKLAWDEELVSPVLFGNERRISALIKKLGLPEEWEIMHVDGDDATVAMQAVQSVKRGETELLMKGQMHTATLFSAVLNKKEGMEHASILSHIAFVEVPGYKKLFGTTDGGLNLAPSFDQKVKIVQNTVNAFHHLGYVSPKIGLLSYVEKVKANDPETGDWAKITEMAKAGEFGEATIDGPFGFDLCLSQEAKEIKNCKSEVAADVDAIVAPNITACNASTKALVLRGGLGAGIVVGAAVPIVALSRGDSPRTRLCSIATGIAMLGHKD